MTPINNEHRKYVDVIISKVLIYLCSPIEWATS